MAASQNPPASQSGATHHVDTGIADALGIGKGGKKLNTHAHELQWAIEDIRDDFLELRTMFINGVRHDVLRNGLLGEIVARTPILVYDLPELKDIVDTAFVDKSGKMYISDNFARRLVSEHTDGLDSANFLIRHEADHLRRLHLTRLLDYPADISNSATDIRINIDLSKGEAAERFYASTGRDPNETELIEAVKVYLADMNKTCLKIGHAMNIEDYLKYDGLSEESIAAMLMSERKAAPTTPNREVSFEDIMKGAAQEVERVKTMIVSGFPLPPTPAPNNATPAELSGLAQDLIAIGVAKANPKKVTDQQIQDAADALSRLREHQGLLELDVQHGVGANPLVGTGTVYSSGQTGDSYLDAMLPSERVKLAQKVLKQILQPSNSSGLPQKPQNGLTIKDIDRMSRGAGAGSPGEQSRGDPNTVPMPNVEHGADHMMDTKDLVDILKGAGLDESSLEKLGYNDLDVIKEQIAAAKDGVVGAINKATEDQMRVGSRYPGGHLLNYAKAQMLDFFKPVLTWESALKKLIDGSGRGSRSAPDEPWTIYHVDAADMGFKRQGDVPYMGSRLPGREMKPLIFAVIDTSNSVDDAMLKRFVTEALNMARKVSRGVAPDVVIVFADTVARGDPVFVTEKNYKNFLNKGINYGGRGGTSFQSSIENIYELVKRGTKSAYSGRTIDAIVYMTDTGDSVPDPARLLKHANSCGLKKLPTTLFLAPKSCHDDDFKASVKKWADIIYFDTAPGLKQTIKLDDIAAQQERKNAGLRAAP